VSSPSSAAADSLGITDWAPAKFPAAFWDVFGEQGHPVRATISDMGPILLARLLNLNDTQAGVLQLVFKIADDNGLLLLDLKDLRAMVQYVGENAKILHHRVRQRLGGVDRRHPARPADAGRAGRRRLLRRADARHQRPDADRRRAGIVNILPPTS
jgi:ribosomal protein S18